MLRISDANIDSFMASICDINDREKYTDEFWTKIEEKNPELLNFILGFVENLNNDDQRAYFLDGLWIMYCLVEREEELNELESLNI